MQLSSVLRVETWEKRVTHKCPTVFFTQLPRSALHQRSGRPRGRRKGSTESKLLRVVAGFMGNRV